jgi:ABC-type transport system involved in multi-copper enzyme maturation permease subunit
MAVHKRAYRPYDGPLTPGWSRLLVMPRYAFQEVFESRLLVFFLAICFLPFLVEAALVYVANSAPAQAVLGITPEAGRRDLFDVGPEFFLFILGAQGVLAFFLTAWVAPVLVSPDLVNGALPLYLSRPFTRAEYVMGKAAVLGALLSLITWVPVLAIFGLQAGLAGRGWTAANFHAAFAIFVGAWVWIAVLTLLGLALSAWVKWRFVATGALFGVFFMGTAFGEAWRETVHDSWGRLANLSYLIGIVWRHLFGVPSRHTLAQEMLDDRRMTDLPVAMAWAGLAAACALCLWLLNRRLQAREVVG